MVLFRFVRYHISTVVAVVVFHGNVAQTAQDDYKLTVRRYAYILNRNDNGKTQLHTHGYGRTNAFLFIYFFKLIIIVLRLSTIYTGICMYIYILFSKQCATTAFDLYIGV